MEKKSSNNSKVLWLLLGCAGLAVVVCLAAVVSVSAWLFIGSQERTVSSEVVFQEPVTVESFSPPATVAPPPTPSAEPTAEPPQEPEPQSNTTDPGSQPTDQHSLQRSEIEAAVTDIRGLDPTEEVSPTQLTMEQLRLRLEEDLLEDYGPEEAQKDAVTLSAFDFIPADFNLYSFILDLYTEQIAGFYDPETDEFVIISGDDSFGGLDQLTHAHEFVHALQDQHFDLEVLDDDSLNSEELFALQSFVEGEATLVQMQFLESGFYDMNELADLFMDLFDGSLNLDMTVLENAPPVIAHELEFPYLAGMEFVQAIYNQGGYDAVNDVWNDLPTTTEQILHPSRYMEGEGAVDVTISPLNDVLGNSWELVEEDTLGEFYLREYLAQQLDGSQVNLAATGWGGDRYLVYQNNDNSEVILVLKLAWDSPGDSDEFESAYIAFADSRFGAPSEIAASGARCWSGGDAICFLQAEGETLIVRGPDLNTVDQVLSTQN